MGNKDRTRDENAATSSDAKDRDQESRDAALARIIAEAVAQQTKSIVEAVSKQKAEGNTITHRCISKADGGDTGAV